MLETKICNAYSSIHTQINYTNNDEPSFEGSQIQSEFFKAWNVISKFYDNKKSKKLTFLEVRSVERIMGNSFAEFCKEKIFLFFFNILFNSFRRRFSFII
jgi:hypothetical protein